jgi:putative ABC transport system ATP-binding protein
MADIDASKAQSGRLLEVQGLAAGAGGKRLVEGLSLAIGPGDILALRGPSGSGKTTVLRAIVGLSDPLAGVVLSRGEPPAALGWPRFRRRIACVPQRAVLLDGTVRNNLELPFCYASAAGGLDEARLKELMAALRLDRDLLEQEARTLSEGQRQRVALLRALLIEPDVLLLDEPTSALDHDNVLAVEELLRSTPALVVTHDAAQVERLAAQVIDLEDHLV